MAIYCSTCGASLPDGVAFCDACGTPVRGQRGASAGAATSYTAPPAMPGPAPTPSSSGAAVICPVCGASALPGEAFCDNCGAALLPAGSYTPAPSVGQPQGQPQPAPLPQYSYQPAPAPGYAPPVQRTASLVVMSPPPPATLSIPSHAELIVGRSDPQSNSYPDVDLGPYGGLDLGVSRRHFRLSHTGDQYYVEDLGSVNGTVVNGQRIPSHNLHPLRSGDRIALGKMELAFELA